MVGCAGEGFFRAEPLVGLLLAVVEHSEAGDTMGSSLIVTAEWHSWGLSWDGSSRSGLGWGAALSNSSSRPIGDSGGVTLLLGDALPRAESTLTNMSLFRLIMAMCALVSFSLGEAVLRGRRDRWHVSWVAFGVLALGFETLTPVLEVVAAAAAASDRLWTAMLGRWM